MRYVPRRAEMSNRTGAERYFTERMKDSAYAEAYRHAKTRIDAVDIVIRSLDERRCEFGWSKPTSPEERASARGRAATLQCRKPQPDLVDGLGTGHSLGCRTASRGENGYPSHTDDGELGVVAPDEFVVLVERALAVAC